MFDKNLSVSHLDVKAKKDILEMYVTCDCCCILGLFYENYKNENRTIERLDRELERCVTVRDIYKIVNSYI